MKKIFISALLVSLLTVSCKKEETVEQNLDEVESVTLVEPLIDSDTTKVPTVSTQNAVTIPTSQVQSSVQNSLQPSAKASGMNPAHGQPRHRCDIAVGAPLNSPPTVAKAKTITPSMGTVTAPTSIPAQEVKITNPIPTSMPATTAPGTNPPHGQPGHVCSTPAAEPLPSPN